MPLTRPLLGTCPTTQACALTGNRTGDPLVRRPVLNPLSNTSQGIYCISFYFVFLNIFIDYAITVVPFPSLHSTPSCTHPPSRIPPYSSCPWVIHINSLASTFPVLFLPSPCLFSTYHLCYLFSVPFPPLSPSYSPVDNSPCDLHFCDSVPDLVVCLVCFCFGFRCGC